LFDALAHDVRRELQILGWGARSYNGGLRLLVQTMGLEQGLVAATDLTSFFKTLETAQASWFYYFLDSIARGERLVAYAPDKLKNSARFLDVGCGYGGSLVAARRYGMQVHGIEIDQKALAGARALLAERQIDALVTDDDIYGAGFDRFPEMNLIVCENVIEHVDDPRMFMRRMFDKLAPGGSLVMEIPNGFALRSVASDPHYALPFLSLLPYQSARRVFDDILGRDVCGDGYSVGDYFPLSWYLDVLPLAIVRYTVQFRNDAIMPPEAIVETLEAMRGSISDIDSIFAATTPLLRENLSSSAQYYVDKAVSDCQSLAAGSIEKQPVDPYGPAACYLAAAWIVRFDRLS
jgi:2-polyprenyl-3-methyl-5-hydroxy-6-metoxy-1,4-benzoquinol methylase